jgi:fibronectin-binding autotransporter adhesin
VSGNFAFGTSISVGYPLTFIAGTSQINLSASSPTIQGNNKTFYNVSYTSASTANFNIQGANTFNNLSVVSRTTAGVTNITVYGDQTINGTLTLSAGTDATMRTFLKSDTIGATRTLTCGAVDTLTDIDFRNITIAGAAVSGGNLTGTRLGDGKGNSGITFDAGVNKYWNLAGNGNWSSTVWATSSGGAVSNDNFPLAQDTCIFEAGSPNSGNTATINATYNIGTIDMSARTTNTMTLACAQIPSIYGNWINGTGTTLSGTGTLTFAGRGSQTITSAGRTFTQGFTIDTPGGSVTLQDAFETNRASATALLLTSGTFDANGYAVTASSAIGGFGSSNSNPRTLAFGSNSTWTIAGTSNSWNTAGAGNLTITGTGVVNQTAGGAKTFSGGSSDYSGITVNQGGSGTLTITGNNSFANITNTYSATGATTISFGTSTQRVANFTASGTAGNVLTIQGSSELSPCNLIHTGAGDIILDYLNLIGVRAYQI